MNYNNNSASFDTKPWNYQYQHQSVTYVSNSDDPPADTGNNIASANIDFAVQEVAVADDHGSAGTLFINHDNEIVYQSGLGDLTDDIQGSTSDIENACSQT